MTDERARARLGEEWREHLRLAMLLLLREAPEFSANASLIGDVLRGQRFRFGCTQSQVRAELDWLADAGLVRVEDLERLTVATLTERGSDVALGLATVTGVKRPAPM